MTSFARRGIARCIPEPILQESLFANLAARCKLAVLSNTDPLHSAVLEAEFSFLRHFPARIYSWRVGASKPSAAIYQAALDALGVDASEALYIDDIPDYVEAARAIGMDAIRFENPGAADGGIDPPRPAGGTDFRLTPVLLKSLTPS